MTRQFTVDSLKEYEVPAKYIVDLMDEHTVFLFLGELGAGKTTLIQFICQQLKTSDVVSSPTFALINPYQTAKGMVYHMDMYRVQTVEEAIDFGVEEYLWEGHICFIEWPERIEKILPEKYVKISIRQNEGTTRELNIETVK